MSPSTALRENRNDDALARISEEDDTIQCPLPARPLEINAITSELCRNLADAGCPLAPALDERLGFDAVLADLSATFVNAPAEQVDQQIEWALRRLVEVLGLDRGSLGEVLPDRRQIIITHSYHRPDAPKQTPMLLDESLPWYAKTIRQGKLLRLRKLPDDLPPEAAAEREYCERLGMKSHVMIPLKMMDTVVGAFGLASFRDSREWPDDLIQRLRRVGEIFTHAVARKRADEALRESEARFRLVAESAPVMVWMSGPDKLCNYFNQHWLDFTGLPLEQELGDGWTKGVHADDLQNCLDAYTTAFDARRPFRMEYRLRRFDGSYRWILDNGVPLLGPNGSFEGYIGSCIDVTEHKDLVESLRAREQSLQETRQRLRELAAQLLNAQEEERRRVAREMHDDWTQRLALLGIDFMKLEKQLSTPETALPLLRAMQKQLVDLSEDVHALSRQLHPSILDDLGLIEALRSECASFSRRERISVAYIAPKGPINVPKNVSLCVYRVSQESLRNVAKHSKVKEACVSLEVSGAELRLRIEDQGTGFDSSAAHAQPTLGHSSMQERVRLIQGRLSITSAPGRGTIVELAAPLARSTSWVDHAS
jgi:PAS domain S-box-containing protein